MIFSRDTDHEAEAVLVGLLRRKSQREKLAMIDDAWETLQSLQLAGIALRHPQLTQADLERRRFELLLGPELAARVLEARRERDARLG